jgi:hypothetical protein
MGGKKPRDLGQHRQHGDGRRALGAHGRRDFAQEQNRRRLAGIVGGLLKARSIAARSAAAALAAAVSGLVGAAAIGVAASAVLVILGIGGPRERGDGWNRGALSRPQPAQTRTGRPLTLKAAGL